MPISVRPSPEQREQLATIGRELRRSPNEIIMDFMTDCLDLLESGQPGVPATVNMLKVLRAARATHRAPDIELRDKQEVAFWQDIQAGRTAGVCGDNPPETITVPAGFPYKVDFAVRVCGDSMEPMIHEGEIGAFRQTEIAQDGRIVAALVDGQTVMKLFKGPNGGPAQLVSLNPKYPSIPCTADTRIQGIYEGKLRVEDIPELARKKTVARRGKVKPEPVPF